MALKTTPTDADVDAFIDGVEDSQKREDSRALCRMMAEETGQPPKMWGSSIVGFGSYHYRYASGREGDTAVLCLTSQKNHLALYVCAADGDQHVAEAYREQLPKADIGKSCVRFKRLDDLDLPGLKKMLRHAARVGGAGAV